MAKRIKGIMAGNGSDTTKLSKALDGVNNYYSRTVNQTNNSPKSL